jgi:hypothetical protein
LIELLVVTAERLGQQSNPIRGRLERVFASERQVLTETVDA